MNSYDPILATLQHVYGNQVLQDEQMENARLYWRFAEITKIVSDGAKASFTWVDPRVA